MNPDRHRGVIIPSYNSGPLLDQTVRAVLQQWRPILVVIDGSTDRSGDALRDLAAATDGLDVLTLRTNRGKGAAVLAGLEFARRQGWTHAAVFDGDNQHEAADLPRFMAASREHPTAMILGQPVFGAEAPRLRVLGRRLGNWFTHLETWWGGIGDSLFGFRVYPVVSALAVLHGIRGGRGFDFDTQMAVHLYWRGVPPVNLPTPVRYHAADQGGISHFHYGRDNLLLVQAHAGLLLRSLFNTPRLACHRRRTAPAAA